jgi:hypothetical protein
VRRKLFGSITLLVVIVAAAQPAAAIDRVRDASVREYGFAIDRSIGGDVVQAWSQDSHQHPYRFQVYWRAVGDPPVRRTGVGTDAGLGGLDLDNSRGALLSYNVFTQHDGYDVRLYDVVAGQPVALPNGVNTGAQETHPTISGDWLLFQRGNLRQGSRHVILRNLQTGERIAIADASPNGIVFGDQVKGDFVVYTVCPGTNRCVVRRYQISTTNRTTLPNAGRAAYYPTLTSSGDVYYVIGHPTRCGMNTQLHHWSGGPHAPKIQQFSAGIEVGSTWAYEPPAGGTDVYFTRLVCLSRGAFRSGIYVKRLP